MAKLLIKWMLLILQGIVRLEFVHLEFCLVMVVVDTITATVAPCGSPV